METQGLGSLVTYLRGDNKSLVSSVSASSILLGKYAKYVSKIGITIGAGFLGAMSIRAFSNFEEQMRNVNTIARQSADAFDETSDSVLNMASTFGKSTDQLTKALYDINSAGFKAARGVYILEEATKSAIAGLSTVEMSARAITGVINSYNLNISEAADVSDILFRTVEKGVLTFEELTTHMGSVLATSAAAKVPFEEIAAAIATMTKKGMVASRAFISLNMFLMQMIKPTTAIRDLFKDFSSPARALQMLKLSGVMDRIQKVTKGSADAIGNLGFNVRAIRNAFALTSDEGKLFVENLESIATKAGRAGSRNRALAEQQKALKFQTKRLGTNLSVLAISIGEVLAKGTGLYTITKSLAGTIGGASELFKGFTGTLVTMALRVVTLVYLLKALKLAIIGIGNAWMFSAKHLKYFFTFLAPVKIVTFYLAMKTAITTVGVFIAKTITLKNALLLAKVAAAGFAGAIFGWAFGDAIREIMRLTGVLKDFDDEWQRNFEYVIGVPGLLKEGKKFTAAMDKYLSDLKKTKDMFSGNEEGTLTRHFGVDWMANKEEIKQLKEYKKAYSVYQNERAKKAYEELSVLKKIAWAKDKIKKLDWNIGVARMKESLSGILENQMKKIPWLNVAGDLKKAETLRVQKKVEGLKKTLKDITESMYVSSLSNEEKIAHFAQKRLDLIEKMRKEKSETVRLEKQIEIKKMEGRILDLKRNKQMKDGKSPKFSDAIIKGSMEDYKASLGQRTSVEEKIESNTSRTAKATEKLYTVIEKGWGGSSNLDPLYYEGLI